MMDYRSKIVVKWLFFTIIMLFGLFVHAESQALTINVVDNNGSPVSGFRWLIEEDNTNVVTPGALVSDSVAVNIHNSYAPTVAEGHEPGSSAVVNVPNTERYVISILPDSGHTLSGTTVAVGQNTATVTVNQFPVPTAQISILVFNDNNAINATPDAGEPGLAGFAIQLDDGGGRVLQDAFGNPLGTTYVQDVNGNFLFNPDGSPQVQTLGNGIILTDADGRANIKYLAPNKYGVVIAAPAGSNWIQTTTIEGTPTIDAWVKAGEPRLLVEFGPALTHIFMGFIDPSQLPWAITPPVGSGTITGRIVNSHQSAPPAIQGFPGAPVPECLIGLNNSAGEGLYATACAEDSTFTINNVPGGTYQIVVWDVPLLRIIGFNTVIVPDTGGTVDLGDVFSFAWFGRLENYVFNDFDGDGFRDCVTPDCDNAAAGDEIGIPEQNVNIRFRDGTIYQAFPTDVFGFVPFDEVFPFFRWLVMEVDYARFKATGATFIVDDGGEIPPDNGWTMPSRGVLNPQPQAAINPNTGNNLSRTEQGVVLTQGMMLFAGQENIIEWGKKAYATGENGGISGIVFYAVTRAENDPRYAVGEPWEAGIPRVQVNLYQDADDDGVIDDLNGDTLETLADVDNYPLGNFPGTEDVDRNTNGIFDTGDAINIAYTDSWDDAKPSGCLQDLPVIHGQTVPECFDNFSTWNQIRPAVFDGGYAFSTYFPGGMDSGSPETILPAGIYIVEATIPAGYDTLKEEHKNVDFGEEYTPSPLLLPPLCVGDDHIVPAELTLFPGIAAPYAGMTRPLCDRKSVVLSSGANAAADFFLVTQVPKAARAMGFVTNDLAAEGNLNSPLAGEKQSAAWIPIAFKDFNGNELTRIYTDEFGAYNALVPSTFTVNIGAPTGVSQNMLDVCLNDPGPIADPANPGQFITDPFFNPSYSVVCYTLNFAAGRTTYLDTPVIPVGAFVGSTAIVDLQLPDGSPVIGQVNGPGQGGPYVSATGQTVTITSLGTVAVPNPAYDPVSNPGVPTTIQRDYSFGSIEGSVFLGGVQINPGNVTWATDGGSIAITVPGGATTGQVMIQRGDNLKTTVVGITLHVGAGGGSVWYVNPGGSIQATIGAAASGDLIIIKPGTYNENVILWKNVTLQGTGAFSTLVNALPTPTSRLTAWRNTVQNLIDTAAVDLVVGQPTLEPFADSEAPGILVLVQDGEFSAGAPGLIDGLGISGSPTGGGMLVNGFAHYLAISNNRVSNNIGTYAGGIRLGSLGLSSANDNVNIHHNFITQNSGINGAGGITIFTGSDNYQVRDNLLLGNLSRLNGGGIYHLGLSNGGTIAGNNITGHEVFNDGQIGGDGGGIAIEGEPALAGALSAGAGSISIYDNLIQSNLAGSGDGGGIWATAVNGQDVVDAPSAPADYYLLDIYNNMLVNNVAAFRGGGIYLQDVARGQILNNTIFNNDSTATAADAFLGAIIPTQTVPQGAGIVTDAHSTELAAALVARSTPQTFSNPTLEDNIVWHNRSYLRDATLNGGLGGLVFDSYWDLAVSGTPTPEILDPQFCILTDGALYAGNNIVLDPLVVSEYVNTLLTAGAGDEGGNFVNVNMSPVGLGNGDYHITSGSPARDAGTANALTTDFDGDVRPDGGGVDIGADEFYASAIVLNVLNVNVLGSGTGTVTSSPVGISCGGDCTAEYLDGTAVTLTATPGANTLFLGWSGEGCSGTGTCEVTMDADRTVTATFRSTFTSLLGLYNHGKWTLDTNGNYIRELTDATYAFGLFADIGVVGDWNGDGKTEIGVYRSGSWRLDTNGNGIFDPDIEFAFGIPTDKPVTGDWNGNGTTDVGVFRDGWWYLDSDGVQGWNPATDTSLRYGLSTDKPVTGDWNGDGITDVGVFRNGWWYLDSDGVQGWNSATDTTVHFGLNTDIPVSGDWNADGKTDIGVYRGGWWYLDSDGVLGWTTGSDSAYKYGVIGELPVSGIW